MTRKKIQAKFEEQQKLIESLWKELEKIKGTSKKIDDERFKRREKGEKYFVLNSKGKVVDNFDSFAPSDDECYDTANYCSDKKLMKKRAAEEVLSRLIWRETEISNMNNKNKTYMCRHFISYNSNLKTFFCVNGFSPTPGVGGFVDEKDAEICIENIVIPFVKRHPELGWELSDEEDWQINI